MWDLVRGAAQLKQPTPAELGRRYTELLTENLGQPGFRELLITVHDADAHRDLVFALVARRAAARAGSAADQRRGRGAPRRGVRSRRRRHATISSDAVAAALTVPLATEWHTVTFAADGVLARRDAPPVRSSREPDPAARRADRPRRRSRSCWCRRRRTPRDRTRWPRRDSTAAAASASTCSPPKPPSSAMRRPTTGGVRIFTIRPAHNPIGPFDFGGGYDDRSDRRQAWAS